MPKQTTEKPWMLVPVLVLVTFLAFLPALWSDFVNWDDDKNFLNNENYRGLGWPQLQWMWSSHLLGRYIPITWMTLGLDYILWGMDPAGYHSTNIAWHCATAALFYFLALALMRIVVPETSPARARLPIGALFAALVFAMHPLRVESVAWVTERRDVVSGFFYVLAILAYLRACRSGPGQPIERRFYWACFASFIAAALSKEIVVTMPLVLLALDFYPLRRLAGSPREWMGSPQRMVWIEKIPFFIVGLIDSGIALYAGQQDRISTPLANVGWFARLEITTYDFAFYMWKTLVPTRLAPFYPLTGHRLDPHALPIQLSAVVVVLAAAGVILFQRKFPALGVAAFTFAVTLLPVSGVFHNGMQIAADRYTYLPCLGFAVLAGVGLLAAWQAWGRTASVGLGVLLVIAMGVLTWRQVETWHDSETLWTHALEVEPSFIAWNNMGMIHADRGDQAGAVVHFRKAIELNPEDELAHNNLGGSLLDLQEWDAAAREFQIALSIMPDLATAHNGWGYALMMQGHPQEAIAHFQTALQMKPDYESARRNFERALTMTKL